MSDARDLDRWICAWLEDRHIAFARFDHPPVFTCEEADRLVPATAVGIQTKNLFLRDKKGTRHWLVVTHCAKAVDIRALGTALDAGRLSFGSPERLMRYLGVTPGAVTLLALAHEGARDVELIVDSEIWDDRPWRCHPMTNAATLVIDAAMVRRFLTVTGHEPRVLSLAAVSVGNTPTSTERDA